MHDDDWEKGMPDRRRHLSIREIAVMLTLLMNFGALVWGAATMNSTVGALQETADEIKQQIGVLSTDHGTRIRLIEAETAAIKARLFFLEQGGN